MVYVISGFVQCVTSFGMRRFGHGAARHIYMDAQGLCGLVDYHQDAYGDLWANFLEPMRTASPAKFTLEQALEKLLLERDVPDPF